MRTIDEESAKNYFVENFFDLETDLPMINRTIELQKIILDLLLEFLRICKNLEIQAYPLFGTLLGTIRHQGFIPWDDDIDMALFRKDYERFINCAQNVLADGYEIIDLSKDKHNYRGSYLRLVQKKSTALEVSYNWNDECVQGVWMDIVPIDCTYNDQKENKEKLIKIREYQNLLRSKLNVYDEEKFKITRDEYNDLSAKANKHSVEKLQYLITQTAMAGDQNSDKVGIFVLNGHKKIYDEYFRKDFSETVKSSFESMDLDVPIGYRRILENRYGINYRKFPALSYRLPHHKCFYSPNVPYEDYRTRFFDVFKNIEEKKVILFGAGHISIDYLSKHGNDYKPEFIVDNDKNKWNKKLSDLSYANVKLDAELEQGFEVLNTDLGNLIIKGPEALDDIDFKNYRLIICSSYFREIETQIRKMGIMEYYIYVQKKEWLLVM